jgi:ABC-type glycerol-3-phosphate transport system permease component
MFFISKKPAVMTNLANDLPLASLKSIYNNVTHSSVGYMKAMEYGCGMMVCAPLIILYLFCQRYLVQGIERSGIVG